MALARAGAAEPWWVVFLAVATLRSVLVPRLRVPPSPKHVGFGEIALCVALLGAFALA